MPSATDEDAEGAISSCNGVELDGRKIVVSEAREQAPRRNSSSGDRPSFRGGPDRGYDNQYGSPDTY